MSISGHTRLYGLIGDPVAHSYSPFIMNRAFGELGMDARYVAFAVPGDRLKEAVAGLKVLGIAGANVTYPHKEAVLLFTDHVSERVEILQAANTLRFTPEGIHAHNTDAPGTALAIQEFGRVSLSGKKVVIFGAGGAGRAAALGVLEAGAASVVFCEMFPSKAIAGLERLQKRFPDRNLFLISVFGEECRVREEAVVDSDILINATPVVAGDPPGARLIEDPKWIRTEHLCFEFTYHPRETDFLRSAKEGGAVCLDGLSLLAAQASESFRRWTGEEFNLKQMASALEAHAGTGSTSHRE